MLQGITPVVLTYNESSNIARTLEQLRWARDIVIVDSFSDDDTLTIARALPQVRVFQRRFDCHEKQWNYALSETTIASEWVLALDADHVLTPAIVSEIETLKPGPDIAGYRSHFVYCINGRPLRGSAYPPLTVLYRRKVASYCQDGHTQRVVVNGEIKDLRSPILHDDRKSLSHWLRAQDGYVRLEAKKLLETDAENLSYPDRIRKARFIAPFFVFFYCLFVKRAILDGWPGLYYAFQRMLAESLLSLRLIEHHFARKQALGGNAG